jgi:hypothetical protein
MLDCEEEATADVAAALPLPPPPSPPFLSNPSDTKSSTQSLALPWTVGS